MSKDKNIDFDSVDLDKIDTDKLSAEEYIRLLKLKGLIKEGNYTVERRKWQDSLTKEDIKEIDAKLLEMGGKEEDK